MKVTKTTTSEIQKLQYVSITEFPKKVVITLPMDCYVEIKEGYLHFRKKEYEGDK